MHMHTRSRNTCFVKSGRLPVHLGLDHTASWLLTHEHGESCTCRTVGCVLVLSDPLAIIYLYWSLYHSAFSDYYLSLSDYY